MTFVKPERKIDKVVVHCSATSRPSVTAEEVRLWHTAKKPKGRGWSDIGYHYFIRTDGTLETGRPLERAGAHVLGQNVGSIGICLNGLEPEDFTPAQFETLNKLKDEINEAYDGKVTFHGHREFANKLCPVFDYKRVMNLDKKGYVLDEPRKPKEKPLDTKPTILSKEVVTASTTVLGASGAAVGSLVPGAQIIVGIGIAAVLLVGAYIIFDKYNKKKQGQ